MRLLPLPPERHFGYQTRAPRSRTAKMPGLAPKLQQKVSCVSFQYFVTKTNYGCHSGGVDVMETTFQEGLRIGLTHNPACQKRMCAARASFHRRSILVVHWGWASAISPINPSDYLWMPGLNSLNAETAQTSSLHLLIAQTDHLFANRHDLTVGETTWTKRFCIDDVKVKHMKPHRREELVGSVLPTR